MNEGPTFTFKVDSFCQRFPEEIPVWGTNFLAFPIGKFSPEFQKQYDALVEASKTLLEGCSVYMYPRQYLHITLGPPALFLHENAVSVEKRGHFERLWHEKVEEATKRDDWPQVFELHYKEMRLEAAAAFFVVEDRSGSISTVRTILKRLSEEIVSQHPDFPQIRIPNIIHTTFLRFMKAPLVSEEEVRVRFGKLQAFWKEPIAVKCEKMVHMREVRPYLHQDNTNNILGEYKYK